MPEQDFELGVWAQTPSLNLYTQICYCFSMPASSSSDAIAETLKRGLERLSNNFPWLAGNIVNEGAREGNTGIFKIRPVSEIPMVVNDLRQSYDVPTWDGLRQAKFPMSMLDEKMLCPYRSIPGCVPGPDSDPLPVFAVQINLIAGGLLLSILGHHQAMDMAGQGQVMHLFSKACRNEPFTNEELMVGNMERDNLIPLLDEPCESRSSTADRIPGIATAEESNPSRLASDSHEWAYFTFEAASLAELKTLATKTVPSSTKYISTDDVLTAFIWQAITRARIHRLDPMAETTLGRAVDVRRYMGIPATFPGLLANKTQHTFPLQTLISDSLGHLSTGLRAAIDPHTSTLAHDTRKAATALARTADKSNKRSRDLGCDVSLSSWTKVDCHSLDFGLGLGRPECVRRPRFEGPEGLVYFLPRGPDGEVAVAICLRDDDMQILRGDVEFARSAKYVG